MFKTIFDKIYLFFYRAFFCFTFITMAMAVFGKLMNTDELYKYMAVKQLFTFFVFSLLFALSFTVADFIKNNVIIKRTVQFVLTYISLVAVFFLGGSFSNYVEASGVQNQGFSILSISFMFVLIYAVCALIVLIVKFLTGLVLNRSKEYVSIFENKEQE